MPEAGFSMNSGRREARGPLPERGEAHLAGAGTLMEPGEA